VSGLEVDEAAGRFLWRGSGAAYAAAVNGEGELEHLHFGHPGVRAEDLPAAQAAAPGWSWLTLGHVSGLEYPAWGGAFFGEPCLKATFADGVRDVRLAYAGCATPAADRLVVALRDRAYPLVLELHYAFLEPGLVERHAVVRNEGEAPVMLEVIASAAWNLPAAGGARLTHLAGGFARETHVHREALGPGAKVLESRVGVTSHDHNPFFAVDEGEAGEEAGEVWFGALAWSGSWRLSFERGAHGVRVVGGINPFDFAWRLEAGEAFTAPAFLAGRTDGGLGEASRILHRHQRERVLPARPAGLRPVLYNSWEATEFAISEEGQAALAERAAALGVELFVVDDGWFGHRDSDARGLGDWTPSPRKFPRGLTPLIERVRALGMRFGLWVEPEMVNADSDLFRAHPDWIYHFPTRTRTERRNQLVLNVGREDVREHLLGVLDALLADHDIAYVKWDMNRPITEPGWPGAPAGRERELWVRHVHGLYELLGALRERHPDVAFESCASGGGRVDLGILRLCDQTWPSDNTDAVDRLAIQEGYSLAYAARTMSCWVADPALWHPGRRLPLAFRFHAAMCGVLGIGGDLLGWSEEELAEARAWVEAYKRVRDVVQEGDLFRLEAARASGRTALQYVRGPRSVVFAFGPVERFDEPVLRLRLRGLDPAARYAVSGHDAPLGGGALMGLGLDVELRGDAASAMVELERVG
jgi:alpha-galactosidase